MRISGIAKTSTIDFPGQLSAVLFAAGCNYDCFYCHNRHIISFSSPALDLEEVKAFLKKRAGLLDGIVFSGGEVTLQPDLQEFMGFCRNLGYKLKIDTNGSMPYVIKNLLDAGLVDYIAVDYKAPWRLYQDICGENVDPQQVLRTIEILGNTEIPWEVRTTVVPQLGLEELLEMAQQAPQLPRYVLNGYRVPEDYLPKDEHRIKAKAHTKTGLEQFQQALLPYQPNTVCGTV